MMKRDSAVSPVIGSILLVAITVIIAAVIAAFVFGMTGDVQKTKIVAVTSQKASVDIGTGGTSNFVTQLQLTNHGGKDASQLKVGSINDTDVTTRPFTVTIDGEEVSTSSTNYQLSVATGGKTLSNEVGSVALINLVGTDIPARNHIVVVGHFIDGTDQVVLDTTE